jgi:hypothetical protein
MSQGWRWQQQLAWAACPRNPYSITTEHEHHETQQKTSGTTTKAHCNSEKTFVAPTPSKPGPLHYTATRLAVNNTHAT